MSQCEWILYESVTDFLYAFVLLNMGWESQTAVLEHLEAGKQFFCIIFTLKDWSL